MGSKGRTTGRARLGRIWFIEYVDGVLDTHINDPLQFFLLPIRDECRINYHATCVSEFKDFNNFQDTSKGQNKAAPPTA